MPQTFETSDPELAHEFLARAYAENCMSLNSVSGRPRLRHSRRDAGPFYRDVYVNSMDVSFAAQPLGRLLIARVTDGRLERDTAGFSERFGPGDVFLVAEPHRPSSCRSPGVRLEMVGVSLAAVADVTGDQSMAEPGRLQLTGYRPVSAAAARTWRHSVDFIVRQQLDEDAAASPLLAASTARLLAATFVSTFASNAVSGPDAGESRDAHPAALRRAVTFIDEHAQENVSPADIAAAALVSVRAVQLAFRRYLDTTPMAYLRRVRLDHAHHDLLTAAPATTVTTVAYRWGFASSSRFTASYHDAYGISPSATLRGSGARAGRG